MPYCKECGKELKPDTKFCSHCGTRAPVKALKAPKELKARPEAPLKIGKTTITIIAAVATAVVIIVVLAAHFGGGSGGSNGGGGGALPSSMISVSAHASGNNVVLTISYEGGDDQNISDLQVQASDTNGTMQTATLSPSSGTLSVGGTLTATYTYGVSPSGKAITVYIIHTPSKQKLFSSASVIVQ
jgi:hypothetical protein